MMQASSRQPRKWTLAEDQKLREEVESQMIAGGDVKDWCRIATQLPGRTNKDCRKRWHNSVAGGLKKGQWSKSEDMLLAKGVQQYGQRWTLVANCVESRSADQCAKRWQQSLDPELDRSKWREDEDKILIEATQHLGRHWKDIQRDHFPGRSKNCIKNRYTVLVRRYQNQGITLPSRASSPSETSTPAPMSTYSLDDEYIPYAEDIYGNLMPPHTQGTSAGSHRSWSSLDSEALPWSSSQDYDMPTTATSVETTHATSSMSEYAFAQPHVLGSQGLTTQAHWNWSTTSIDPSSSSIYARSPVSYTHATYPVPPHYDDSRMARPVMSSNASYSTSPAPNEAPTSMPQSRIWSEEQHYDSLSSGTYPNSRLQQNPLNRF